MLHGALCCGALMSDEHMTHNFSLDRFQVLMGLLGHDLVTGCGVIVTSGSLSAQSLRCTSQRKGMCYNKSFVWAQIMHHGL